MLIPKIKGAAIKRNELLIHVATWMNLKSIMLSERSQAQKAPYYVIQLVWHSEKDRIIGTDIRSVVSGGWR